MSAENKDLKLLIVTPTESFGPIDCDSVKFCITGGKNENADGFYGIRKGHASSVFSLRDGAVIASLGGKTVQKLQISGGFATVENNLVTVATSKAV